jgi:single-stranded-DNA-specific exonuclease
MITDDYEEAIKIAKHLNELNEKRKEIENKINEEALMQLVNKIDSNNCFVFNPEWHSGVLGIVASRLKEKFNKPSLVLCCENDIAHGSGRSTKDVDLGAIVVLGKQKGILKDGGGHKVAAGFSCDLNRVEEVEKFFTEQIKKQTKGKELINSIHIDGVTSIKGATLDFVEKLQLLAPFGNGNPKPKICINDVIVSKTIVMQDKHLKCFLTSPFVKGTLETISFNALDTKLGEFLLNTKEPFSIVGSLSSNSWNGKVSVQFILEDAKN